MTDAFRDRLAAALAATYRIDDELVGGGMSRVFAATEHALGRKVVIKVLPPELSAGVNRERFQREIQVAAQLQHPHIVPLLSAGRIPSPDAPPASGADTAPGVHGGGAAAEGELLYYTMPFIEGESLRTAIARRGRLPVREVVRVLHDVVEALAYAHARGVVHRDIKPGNILTLGSHALVTDFGVAKALSVSMPVSGMTSAGMAIGTPAYMAPEQLAADPAADHRIDIYAVGLLAYELLSGQSPFVGTSPQATMAAQLTRVPESLDTVRDDVPPGLAAVIMRCLEKLPEHRPQTAEALLDELAGVSTPSGGIGSSGPATTRVDAARPRPSVQRRAVLAGAMMVVVAGAAIALVTSRRATQGASVTTVTSAAPAGVGSATGAATAGASGGASGIASQSGPAASAVRGDSAVRTPIVLTPAESLAIAEAIRKRVTARRDSQVAKGERALGDSLTARFERVLSDSLTRIIAGLRGGQRVEVRGFDPKEIEHFRELSRLSRTLPNVAGVPRPAPGQDAPPAGTFPDVRLPVGATPIPPPPAGVHRVLLGAARDATPRRTLGALGAAITDSLRRAISARPGYDVVDAAALGDPRVMSSRSRSLARAIGAGAVVSGLYYAREDSSVMLQLQIFDLQQNRVLRVIESRPIDRRDPMREFGDVVARTLAALEDVAWSAATPDSSAPRRPDAPARPR